MVSDIKAAAAGSMALSGSGSSDRTVRLWDLRTGGGCVRTMEGHSRGVQSVDMDGQCRTAVSNSSDKTFKLWDLGSGRCTETFEGPEHSTWAFDVVMYARVREQLPQLWILQQHHKGLGRGQGQCHHAGGHGILLRSQCYSLPPVR